MDNIDVLGIKIDELSYENTIEYINNSNSQIVVSTVNPEIVLECEQNLELRNVINNSDLRTADGIGIVWAVKKLYKKEIDKVTGIDLMEKILKSNLKDKKTFLYGSKPGVADMTIKVLNEKYECNIVGAVDGYSSNQDVLDKINGCEAELLFVGLGCPAQELWIDDNRTKLPSVKLLMGVGGSFDVLSGNIARAPKKVQKMHLEWLYRLVKQPKRIVRQLSLVKFVFKVLSRR